MTQKLFINTQYFPHESPGQRGQASLTGREAVTSLPSIAAKPCRRGAGPQPPASVLRQNLPPEPTRQAILHPGRGVTPGSRAASKQAESPELDPAPCPLTPTWSLGFPICC